MNGAITEKMRGYLIDEIRRECIKNDWYTCGSNEAYDSMFKRATEPTEDGGGRAKEIALDIWKHSEDEVKFSDVSVRILDIYNGAWAIYSGRENK